ncbi:hypothetical protein [Paenibacillus sp. sgz500958]|uniref:hypothetical protein n=1 Tax=Paenibacillus sp. sgz500958 TaxID=3242475 RepID=UPI0036D24DD0
MEKLISRYDEGKFAYLMAITPTIEGSYVIYDIISTGTEVRISIDYSRDPYSDGSVNKYQCNGISMRKETDLDGTRSVLMIKDCTGKETVKEAGILTFEQE